MLKYEKIIEAYGKNNWGNLSNFKGNYINFGCWEEVSKDDGSMLNVEQRILSSSKLYDMVIDSLNVQEQDSVLEVGCGLGMGCAKIVNYNPKKYVGIDVTPGQVRKAKEINKHLLQEHSYLSFKLAAAEETTFPDLYFDKIYSIEAAQHFISMENFSQEMSRVIKKNGVLVIAAHFSTNEKASQKITEIIPYAKLGIDLLPPIQEVIHCVSIAGFSKIETSSIGANVFPGYQKWVKQENGAPGSETIYEAYDKDLIDYYIIKAVMK